MNPVLFLREKGILSSKVCEVWQNFLYLPGSDLKSNLTGYDGKYQG